MTPEKLKTIHPDWMTQEAIQTLSAGYLLPGETVSDSYSRVAKRAAHLNEDPSLEEDLFECLWEGFIGLASPVFANFGSRRGYPISCYSVDVGDSISSIYSHKKEVAMMSKMGGGVGVNFSRLRPKGSPISGGGKSSGVLGWMQEFDLTARKVSQGGELRKGSFALYIDIEHPDYLEALRAKDQSTGDPREWIDSNLGVVIHNSFLERMIAGGEREKELFAETLKTRLVSGSPYLLFIDNVNERNPQCYKERGLEVSLSNLCSEITGYTDENHSFVCVLSSVNLAKYLIWRNWRSPRTGRTVPQIAIHLLEAVTTEFIHKAKNQVGMGRAVRFAEKSRMLGLGTMGLHTLYQTMGFPFESKEARELNIEVHKFVREEADKASQELAERFGEPEWCEGSGFRHSHRIAIAPTRTNSVITGAFSQGIEPMESNLYVAKQDKGVFLRKNPVLEKLLCDKGVPETVWKEILDNSGSVQNLDCLSEQEKEVFKTAREIDQFEIVKQAIDRQDYVCQAQSVNLFVKSDVSAEYLIRLHVAAGLGGLKSLYYLKSKSAISGESYDLPDNVTLVITRDDCPWCSKLKDQLSKDGIPYQEILVEEAKAMGMWSEEWKTVPRIYFNSKWIGGYTEYMASKMNSEIVVPIENEPDYSECSACEA
jgi:ribonucleoside-diphosphate reductase alpha chain